MTQGLIFKREGCPLWLVVVVGRSSRLDVDGSGTGHEVLRCSITDESLLVGIGARTRPVVGSSLMLAGCSSSHVSVFSAVAAADERAGAEFMPALVSAARRWSTDVSDIGWLITVVCGGGRVLTVGRPLGRAVVAARGRCQWTLAPSPWSLSSSSSQWHCMQAHT